MLGTRCQLLAISLLAASFCILIHDVNAFHVSGPAMMSLSPVRVSSVAVPQLRAPLVPVPQQRSSLVQLSAKKGKKGKGKGAQKARAAKSTPLIEALPDDEEDSMDMSVEASFSADAMMPDGALTPPPLPSKETDKSVKDLIQDRSLESKFVEIPKGAIVPDNMQKKEEEIDGEGAFGLPGYVVSFIKKGTWACIALLVFAEVWARSPLSEPVRGKESLTVEMEKKGQREELDIAGKTLPGIRPWAPVNLSPPSSQTPPPVGNAPAPAPAAVAPPAK